MKVFSSNNSHISLPFAFSILFFCFLFSSGYTTLSQCQFFIYKAECPFSCEKESATNDMEGEKESGEDANSLFVIEGEKVKFTPNRECKYDSSYSVLVAAPFYDIHLPPPKNMVFKSA